MLHPENETAAQPAADLLSAMECCERHVTDMLLSVIALSEMLERPTETPRADGGRPLRHLRVVWDDAAEYIAEAQKAAKYCADDMMLLLDEARYYVRRTTEAQTTAVPAAQTDTAADTDEYRRKYEATRATLEQYAADVREARAKQKKAERRAGALADIYGKLYGMTVDRMSEKELQEFEEFKDRVLHKTE